MDLGTKKTTQLGWLGWCRGGLVDMLNCKLRMTMGTRVWPLSGLGVPNSSCGAVSLVRFPRRYSAKRSITWPSKIPNEASIHPKMIPSLDWFKGKSTGNHGLLPLKMIQNIGISISGCGCNLPGHQGWDSQRVESARPGR